MKELFIALAVLIWTPGIVPFKDQPGPMTFVKLYTKVSGVGGNRLENWYLANNSTRRMNVTLEMGGTSPASKGYKETKVVTVEPKASLPLGLRSMNGSAPSTIILVKAEYIP